MTNTGTVIELVCGIVVSTIVQLSVKGAQRKEHWPATEAPANASPLKTTPIAVQRRREEKRGKERETDLQ